MQVGVRIGKRTTCYSRIGAIVIGVEELPRHNGADDDEHDHEDADNSGLPGRCSFHMPHGFSLARRR